MKKYLILLLILLATSPVYGATVVQIFQGGTGLLYPSTGWSTGYIPFGQGLSAFATSTGLFYNNSLLRLQLTNFTASTGTTTSATSTSFFASTASSTDLYSTNLTFGGVTGNSWDDFCVSITGGSGLCDGNDASGAGGGDFPFDTETNFGDTVSSTSTLIWLKDSPVSLAASSTSYFTKIINKGWTVASSTTVCLTGTDCQYSTIQSAIDAGWRNIYVKDGTYSEQLTIANTKTKLQAESLNTIIQCNGVTQSPCVDGNAKDELVIDGFTIRETNATLNGVGIDIGDVAIARIRNNRINNFATSTQIVDTASNSFYGIIEDNTFFSPKVCVEFSGTQANQNTLRGNRCRPMAVDGGFGVYISDSRGITLEQTDVEGTTTTKTNIGVYVDGTSREIVLDNPWIEAIGTGLQIQSGANRVTVVGGSITSNGTDITDNGTQTVFLNTSDTGVLVNKLGTATTTNLSITALTSALIQTEAGGYTQEYSGTSCTNQFVRVLSALGIATCESVDNGDFGDADWGDITIASNVASVEDDSHAHTSSSISGIDISADTNLTAGDALTLTDDDIDFDGGTAPGGELGGTWASPTIDDSLAVTSWNLTTPTFTTSFTIDAETLDSLTDDITLANNGGDLQVVDVTCTNCLGGTEIDESTLTISASGANSKWATSSADSTAIHTASAAKVGIGSSTPWGLISLRSTNEDHFRIDAGDAGEYGSVAFGTGGDFIFDKTNECTTCGYSFEIDGNQKFFISDDGRVGINANFGPISQFTVYSNATTKITSDLGDSNDYGFALSQNTNQTGNIENDQGIAFVNNGVEVTASIVSATTSTRGKGTLGFYTKRNTTAFGAPTLALLISDDGFVGIGTSTPQWHLQVSSSTKPQFTLSDSSVATFNHWSFRNAGGLFYLATSSPTTFSTSTVSAFSIDSNGKVAIPNLTPSRAVFTDSTSGLTTTGTVGSIEAAVGSQNILLETEIDACSELAALLDQETGGCGAGVGPVFSDAPTFTGITTFSQILANSSTTLQNFTFVNATGTKATTTNSFATTASSTNLFSTSANIGTLTVQSCTGCSSSSLFTFSTTTSVQMSTTTCSVANGCLPQTNNIEITFTTSNMVGANLASANTVAIFNSDSTNTYSQVHDNVSNGTTAGVELNNRNNIALIDGQASRPITYFKLRITNHTGVAKLGTFDSWRLATTTGAHSAYVYRNGTYVWENASQLSSIDIGLGYNDTQFGTSTKIEVLGW